MKYVKYITSWCIYEQEFGAKFLASHVRQYRLLMFTNTESLSKTKRNLIFRMGQEIQL